MKRHFRIWLRMASTSAQAQLTHQLGSLGFLLGKLIRLFSFLRLRGRGLPAHRHPGRLHLGRDRASSFLTFNIVDVTAQVFFRGIYGAKRTVETGTSTSI